LAVNRAGAVAALATGWRRVGGRAQWRILWLANAKFGVGVVGVIRDDAGRVLLLRHRFHKEPGWALPGGWMKRGERFEDGLAREVAEETGYVVRIDSLVRLTSGYRLRIEICYSGRCVGGVRRLDPDEVLAADFFDPADLPADLLPAHRALIAAAADEPNRSTGQF
jgi:8-oxo-dGTP diphosphatase